MLVDANLLLFAVWEQSPHHAAAKEWLRRRLGGAPRLGLPWQSLATFLRLATNPRVFDRPLTAEDAWGRVSDWIGADAAWIPEPGPGYAEIFGGLISRHGIRGDLVPDAQLAALALEHGLTVCSADTDFARFPEVRWENPVAVGHR